MNKRECYVCGQMQPCDVSRLAPICERCFRAWIPEPAATPPMRQAPEITIRTLTCSGQPNLHGVRWCGAVGGGKLCEVHGCEPGQCRC